MSLTRPHALAGAILLIVILAYPAVVYILLERVSPFLLALMLIVVVGVRLKLAHLRLGDSLWLLAVAAAGFLAAVAVTNSAELLKFYPVFMNAIFLAVFVASLFYPPSMIERFATAARMEMSEQGRVYTRGVTVVWCLFFVVNASISAWLALSGDDQLWALYTGIYSYLAMAALFVLEYAFRGVYQRRVRSRSRGAAS